MTFESSCLIGIAKVAIFIVIAAFLLLGSLWLRFKFPVDENGCPLNIDPFDFRKDQKNGENDSDSILEDSSCSVESAEVCENEQNQE